MRPNLLATFLCLPVIVGMIVFGSNARAQINQGQLGSPPSATAAPSNPVRSVTGAWVGTLRQGTRLFDARLDLQQTAEAISGSSNIAIDQHSARMSVSGTVNNALIILQEEGIESATAGSSWCIKAMRLELIANSFLSGEWTAPNCVGGTITLTRAAAASPSLTPQAPAAGTTTSEAPLAAPSTEAPSSALTQSWVHCATEGEFCSAPAGAVIHYGLNSTFYHLRSPSEGLLCDNSVFNDPLPGIHKECLYSSDIDGPLVPQSWVHCATEGGFCNAPSGTLVHYGLNGAFAERRSASGGLRCDNGVFRDPLIGVHKECFIDYAGENLSAGNATFGPAGPAPTRVLPVIDAVSAIHATPVQTITISGHGFGTHNPYTNRDSSSIRLRVFPAGAAAWNAGSDRDSPPDKVTLDVTSWTDSQIVLAGLDGAYAQNNWRLHPGERVTIQIWSAQTGAGPAEHDLTVSATTAAPTTLSNGPSTGATADAPHFSLCWRSEITNAMIKLEEDVQHDSSVIGSQMATTVLMGNFEYDHNFHVTGVRSIEGGLPNFECTVKFDAEREIKSIDSADDLGKDWASLPTISRLPIPIVQQFSIETIGENRYRVSMSYLGSPYTTRIQISRTYSMMVTF